MSEQVMELKRLNEHEIAAIIAGLEVVATYEKGLSWAAKALLENDAVFVRGLFWTSKSK